MRTLVPGSSGGRTWAVVTLVLCLSFAACKGKAAEPPAASGPGASASVEPSPAGPPPTLYGNAAKNPACEALSVEEVQEATGVHVHSIDGIVGPGAYSKTQWHCAWHLDETDIDIPAVQLQYEITSSPPSGYYRQLIDQGYAKEIPGLGDIAELNHFTVDAIDGRALVHLQVVLHEEPSQEQADIAIQLVRTVFPRIKP